MRRVVFVALFALAATVLPGLAPPAPPALAGAGGPWNGSRAEMFIVNVVQPSIVAGGPAGAVTANLINNGPSTATNVRFTYLVPSGLTFGSASVAGGSCTFAAASRTVTCTRGTLLNGATAAIAISVSAPAGTTAGSKAGSFTSPTSDQFNPAGGNILDERRTENWVGGVAGDPLPPVWPPSDPYTGPPPPCFNIRDSLFRLHDCDDSVVTNNVRTAPFVDDCLGTFELCLRTWEMIGTYYATESGQVRFCANDVDDGAYVNWSAGYDPAVSRGPVGPYTSKADLENETQDWNTGNWAVTAGQAYRFSIRVANRDTAAFRGVGEGGIEEFGLSAVNGSAATCLFDNFWPPKPANVTVAAPSATIRVTKSLGTARIRAADQFTVQLKNNGGTVVNSTANSTTTGSGSTVTAGTGTTGTTQVTPGLAYTLTEVAAGTTLLADYNQSIACTNTNAGSTTTLPSGPVNLASPPTITPAQNDAITCTLSNTGVPPTVTILTSTDGADATFTYAVTGGPTPVGPSITTTGGTGSVVLANTLTGQIVNITENPLAGWSMSMSLCTNRRTGAVVTLPYALQAADQIFCSFANRAVPPPPQACNINPVANPSFALGGTSWTVEGAWTAGNGRMSNIDDGASFLTDRVTQTIGAVAPGSQLSFDVALANGPGGTGGNPATLRIFYNGTEYATIETAPVSAGFGGNAVVTGLNNAVVSVSAIPMGTVRRVAITLPTNNVPRTGDLQFRYGISGSGDSLGVGDDVAFTAVAVRTTAICLQKQSTAGFATFGFTTTNLDTNTTTAPAGTAFSVTTSASNNPATVNPTFGRTGTQLVVVAPGSPVTITETSPAGWSVSAVSCTDAISGAAVGGVTLTGKTVTIAGGTVPARTVLNCLITDATLGYRVTKVASPATAAPGSTVTYTVTVQNTGSTIYPGASFTDDLTGVLDDATFGSASATLGTATFTAPNLSWTGDLPGGGTATITYTVVVNSPDTGNHRLSNVVTTTSSGGNCADAPRPAVCQTDTPVADSRTLKSVDRTSAAAGDTLTYTIRITNVGSVSLVGASFTDDLTGVLDDATFGSASATIGSATFTSPALAWTGTLPVAATATITYTVTVNNPDLGDHNLANVVSSTTVGNNCAAGSTDTNCRTSTPLAGLRIVKSADDTVAAPGQAVIYTVTVTNIGRTTQTGTLFTDNLADVLDDATVGSVTASTGTAQPSGSQIIFGATLAPGAVATVTYTSTVRRPDTGNHLMVNAVSSTAPGSTCPAGTNGSVCTVTIPIVGLHLQKSVNVTQTEPGATVTYTTTLTNTGQAPATGVSFTDDLSGVVDDAVVGTPSASSGTVSFTSPTLTWTGDVAVGATVTVTYTATVNRPVGGDHRLKNLISSTTPGTDCPGRPGCTTDTPIAELQITKTANVPVAAPGQQVSYTVTVANIGQVAFASSSGVDDLTGVLDDATLVSAVASGGDVVFNSPLLSWTSPLPIGVSGSLTYVVLVNRPDTGDHHLINSMSTDTPGGFCPEDPTCHTDTPVAELTVTKSVNVTQAVPGQIVTYTVAVTNVGAIPAGNLVGIDDATGVIDDATFLDAVVTGGTIEFQSPLLIWTGSVIPVPVGFTATAVYRFQVNNPDTGDHRLINSLSSNNIGVQCPGGPACSTDTPVAELAIDKTVDPTVVNPGDAATYSVVVTNRGQTSLAGATFSDDLSDVVDDAVVGGVAATVGTASLAGSILTWTGDLAPGASSVVTYEATVNVPDAGNRVLANALTSATPGSTCPTAAGPGCSTSTQVPGYEISKTNDHPTANPGDTVTYTVVLRNLGQTEIVDAAFTDDLSGVLDDAAFGVLTQPSIGTAVFATTAITWTGTLAVAATTTFTYTVVVNGSGGDHVMTNVITSATPRSNCPLLSVDPRCRTTTLVNGLSIQKTNDHPTALPGDTVSHTVTVTNTGQTALTGATFTDDLTGVDDDAAFGVLTPPTIGTAVFNPGPTPTVTWTGDLGPGASTAVTYTLIVDQPGTGDHVMTNRVSSTTPGTDCPPATTNPACLTTTRVSELRIAKTPSVSNAAPGGVVGYTVVVSNVGAVLISGARFTDNLAGVLDDATYVSATATAGSVTFTTPILTWTGDLAVGASVTVAYTLRVNQPDLGDALLRNSVSSTTPGTDCAICTTDTPISRLSIVKSVSQPTALPGDTLIYTVVVTNTGQVALTANVTDNLTGVLDDATVNPASVTASTGAASFTSPNVTWSGALAPGGVPATITYSVTVNDPDLGDLRLVNAITSTTPGNNCPCATDTPVGGLTIIKSADRPAASVGESVNYTIVVANVGQTPITGASLTDDLTGILDDAVVDLVTSSSGVANRAASTITWSGDLAVGAVAIVAYRATVTEPGSGDHRLTNTVVSPTPGNNCPAGSVDPRCATDTPIGEIVLAKTASHSPVSPGETLTYTVTVANVGQTVETSATFADNLTGVLDDAEFVDATATIGSASFATPTLTWTGDIPVGQTATVTYRVAVRSPATGDHLLVNAVTSTTPGANCRAASDCSVDVAVSDVQVSKTVNRTSTVPLDTVTYTVTVTNSGQSALTGATFTDDLSGVLDDATFGTATATIGTATFATPALSWTGDLAVGATATVTYTVQVRAPDDPGDHTLANVVIAPLPGSNCTTPTSDPAHCTTTVPVASLNITKAAAPVSTEPGGTVTYTVTVTNTGRTPQTGLLFVDDLTGVLDDATFGTVTATVGSASFSSPELAYAATLPPGGVGTVTYTVEVRDPEPGDLHLVNLLASSAPGAICTAALPCTTDTPVGRLTVVKTADRTEAAPGDVVTYTVALANTGQTGLTGATFTDNLSGVLDDATFGTASSTVGTAVFISPNLVWTGDLATGASTTVTYTVTVREPDPGDHRLINELTSAPGSSCPAAQPCRTDTPVDGLDIVKQVDRATAAPGDVVTYTVSLVNTGQTAYTAATFTDDLTGVLDDASFGTVSASTGTAAFTTPNVTWTGDVAIGGSVTVIYRVTVNAPGTGDHVLTNSITSAAAGATCPVGTPCVTTTPITELSIVKTATPPSAQAGDTVQYQLLVRNLGQVPYIQITVVDNLVGALDDATFGTATATSGIAVFTSPTLTWTGNVPIGGTVTITYDMTVVDTATGDRILTNSVTSPAEGSSCAQLTPCTTGTPVNELLITKVASATSVPVGGVIDYTITVTNHGQTDLPGATVTDVLTGVLDDAVVGTPAATVGSAIFTSPNLVWTGDLPIGAVATITYPVTVNAPDIGDHLLVNVLTSTTPGSGCRTSSPCTVTTPVTGLTITKSVDRTTANLSDTVTYTVDITNSGQAPLVGVTVRDDLSGVSDDAATLTARSSNGSAVFGSGQLVWTGDIDVGASATVTYSVLVNRPGTGDHRLINAAFSDTPGSNCSITSPCTTDTPVRELRVVKTVGAVGAPPGTSLPRATPGQDVQYTMVVTNIGQVDEPAASVTDDLTEVFDDATFGSVSATAGSASLTAPFLVWVGPLAINADVTITYLVHLNNPDSGDHRLANGVTTTSPLSGCPLELTCSTTTPIADLSIVKTVDRTTAAVGDTVTYTLTITNLGQEPLTGANAIDNLTGVLDDATFGAVTSANAPFASPNVVWTGDLAVGAPPVVVTYTVVVNRPDTGDHKLTNAVLSTTGGATCSLTALCTTTTPVAEWTISKVASPSSAGPGGTVTYTVTVTNTGEAEVAGATFTDDLTAVLDDATFGTVSASAGIATFTSPLLTWTGTLPVGGPPVTVSYTVTVNNPSTGDQLLTNTVTSPTGTCVACTTTTPVAAFTISKAASAASAVPGGAVAYTVTVTNTGQAEIVGATFTDDLTAVLDDATFGTASASAGTATFTSPLLTWTGTLPVGGPPVTVSYTVTVNNPSTGDQLLTNTVTSPTGTCVACTTTTPVGAWTIAKTAVADLSPSAPGGRVTYTVTLVNTGQVPIAGAAFTDDLTAVLDDATLDPASVTATVGSATFTSPLLSWTGALPVGGPPVTVSYVVAIHVPDTGDHILTNTITSPTGACLACTTTTPVAEWTILKVATPSSSPVVPGGTVSYTVTLTNTGQQDIIGATFTDDLTAVLDDATVAGVTASAGTAVLAPPALTWTGDLPLGGAPVTVSYVATVGSPDTGDHLLVNSIRPPVVVTTTLAAAVAVAAVGEPFGICLVCATTTAVGEWTVNKAASAGSTVAGGTLTYTVTLTNTGAADIAATFTDDLTGVLDDATVNPASVTATAGTATFVAPNLSWTGTLPTGGPPVVVTYQVTVNNPGTGDHLLTNAVTASAGSVCAVCTTTTPVAEWTITKAAAETPSTLLLPGGTVAYSVTLVNLGPVPIVGATFTDDLTGVLDDATVNPASITATVGTATFTAPNLVWTGTLPVGGPPVVVAYTVTVNNPVTGDRVLTNAVTSTTGTCLTCTTTTPVGGFQITKSAAPAVATAGQPVTYTVTVSNPGQTAAVGATFTDDLTDVLDDATFTSVSSTVGTATFTAPSLQWTGDIPAGASGTITYVVTVNQPPAGDHQLTNVITSPAGACLQCTTTTPVAELAIAKQPDRSPAAAGDLVTYTLVMTNAGQTPYLGATVTDNLAGVLDDAVFVGAAATTGSVTFTSPNLVWTGDLPVGGSATVTYQVRVNSPDTGDHRLVNAVTSAAVGSGCPGAAGCTTDTAVAELVIIKQAQRALDTVTYTVDVTNTGQVDEPAASFTDDLTAVLDDATFGTVSATVGTATFSSPILSWTGSLSVGAAARVTYTVSLKTPNPGDGVLVNAVVSTAIGSSCPLGTPNSGCAVILNVGVGGSPSPSPSVSPSPSPSVSPSASPSVSPSASPSVSASPSPSVSASPSPSVSPSPTGPATSPSPTSPGGPTAGGPTAGGPTLARPTGPGESGPVPVTGFPLVVFAESAVLLLLLGSLVLWWARRRRTTGEHRQ